jgi:PhnB protein
MAVKPIPEGYHSITPYMNVKGAAKLIDFLKQAFGGEAMELAKRPDGVILHAEVKIGDSRVMISEAADMPANQASVYLYVQDVDATYKRALAAGATSTMDITDKFYGDRSGGVKDAWGNRWMIATHKEDVSKSELERRFQEFLKQQKAA